jgi:hypothetical protein
VSCPISLEALSPAARKAADPAGPAPARMMAARGMAPMPPKDLVTAQFVLTFDPDAKIADAARGSLAKLDARIANAVLGDASLDPHVLGYLAETLAERDAEVERLLLNNSTPSSAFVAVAAVCSQEICEVIANNQARLLEEAEIARALTRNPRALRSTVDRTIDFLVRSGIVLEGAPEFEAALLRLGADDRMRAANAVDVPLEFIDASFLSEEERAQLAGERRLITDDEQVIEDEGLSSDQVTHFMRNFEKWYRDANLSEKVAMATKGNKTARARLVRDTNRVVAMAAITSPAISEPEVVAAAQSRIAHQDVVSYIARQRDWVRNYAVKVALVNNPKCPVPEAMKLVPSLQRKDLRALAVSKNVSGAVRAQAQNLGRQRGGE